MWLMIEDLSVFCSRLSMEPAPPPGVCGPRDPHTAAHLCLPLDFGPLRGGGCVLGTILFPRCLVNHT